MLSFYIKPFCEQQLQWLSTFIHSFIPQPIVFIAFFD